LFGWIGVKLVTALLDASASVRCHPNEDEGQTFVEYAVVMTVVIIAIAVASFLTPLKLALEEAFGTIRDAIGTAGAG
jgi:Flp pilus assembly pilin Flp